MTDITARVTRDEKNWEAKIEAEIPAERMARYRDEALKELQKAAKLQGFRTGHVPLEKIVEIYGEPAVMRAAAEHAISHEVPQILAKENLLIIESPKVVTDTPESGKQLSFTATAPLAPSVTLPDYRAIAEKIEKPSATEVTDQEHDDAIRHIGRERSRIDRIESGIDPAAAADEAKALKDEDLPALDDAFAQSLGYADLAAFSAALRTNIETEKVLQQAQKRRSAILEALVKESKISYPVRLREYEIDEIESRLKDDLERSGVSFDAYLADINKTREGLRSEWQDPADQRVKVRLILSEIARVEKLDPPSAVVDHELEHAREHYPKMNVAAMRANIVHALRNEMAMRALEGNAEPVGHADHDH